MTLRPAAENPMHALPNLLIVTPAAGLRAVLEFSLAHCGDRFHVFSAPSEASALLEFDIVQPGLVLLDIGLAEPEAWEALRRLRALSSVPIILISAANRPDVTIRGLELGADYCMFQPLEIQQLRLRVRSLLRATTSPSGRAGSSPPAQRPPPVATGGTGRGVTPPRPHAGIPA